MSDHEFGGDWTDTKLDRMKKYLIAYRTIFTRNAKAQFLKTWYVDAFAGSGSRADKIGTDNASLFLDVYEDAEPTAYRDGSATIALSLPNPFDRYLFIEANRRRVEALELTVRRDFPALAPRCDFNQGDANEVLRAWCHEQNWRTTRAVVFLDPYGMQVNWPTIEVLAKTEAIDLWYLFPLGMGVSRLLRHDGNIDAPERKRLDDLFGTGKWQDAFYTTRSSLDPDLFPQYEAAVQRDASVEKITSYFKRRLETCFPAVADGLVLRNSKNSPMYLLCFAAANKKAAKTALKIAQSILGD